MKILPIPGDFQDNEETNEENLPDNSSAYHELGERANLYPEAIQGEQGDVENQLTAREGPCWSGLGVRSWNEGLRILLVDDSDLNRKMCRRLLSSYGHEVEEASDGRDCLKKYEEKEKRRMMMQYDLILLDDNMPNLLGYETAKV